MYIVVHYSQPVSVGHWLALLGFMEVIRLHRAGSPAAALPCDQIRVLPVTAGINGLVGLSPPYLMQ